MVAKILILRRKQLTQWSYQQHIRNLW